MKADRILEMERFVHQKQSVSMEELRDHFGISMNTVRRDVAQLVAHGTVRKVYGGVCARRNDQIITPYEVRSINKKDAKTAIGRKAAELVQDGDVIFIDSGTTTLQMVDFLLERQNLTIITNNLDVIVRAISNPEITILALPGHLDRKTNSFIDSDVSVFFKRYNIRTAFMAATGVCSSGATNSSPPEYRIKKNAIEASETAVLLVAHDKFGVSGLMTYAPLSAFSALVTDAVPDEEYQSLLSGAGVALHIAP